MPQNFKLIKSKLTFLSLEYLKKYKLNLVVARSNQLTLGLRRLKVIGQRILKILQRGIYKQEDHLRWSLFSKIVHN